MPRKPASAFFLLTLLASATSLFADGKPIKGQYPAQPANLRYANARFRYDADAFAEDSSARNEVQTKKEEKPIKPRRDPMLPLKPRPKPRTAQKTETTTPAR